MSFIRARIIAYINLACVWISGKCVIENADSGYAKLVLDENEVILGAQLVCPHATEMIGELALAVQKKLTAGQLAEVIHPHPTINEMVAAAAK
ncbi:MAG: hypothetical protein II704_01840 [Erysipelotrichaceae bacterium]|nr:hypothetical protein [Erysipelotrichaceae bacterium]